MVREIKWYGLTEDDVKKLDLHQFMRLIPAKVRRSLARGLTDAEKRFLKCIDAGKNNIKTHCRDMVVLPNMLGKTVLVYTGKEYTKIVISLEMLGLRLGELAPTRKTVSHSAPGIGATRSSAFASVK